MLIISTIYEIASYFTIQICSVPDAGTKKVPPYALALALNQGLTQLTSG